MKQISDRRRKRLDEARPVREQLRAEATACEWCGRANCGRLDIHEIIRGSLRPQALDQRCCLLVLGRTCHDVIHRMGASDGRLCGLAILYHVRSSDYDLRRFVALLSPFAPERITQREVDVWISRLTVASERTRR